MEQGGAHSGGFTIIETLIVLSISAILAVSALLLVNGRQNKIEFQTSINTLQQSFQELINETSSGYYPAGGFTCTPKPAGQPPQIGSGSSTQGTSTGCIFLGKAVQFAPSGDKTQYVVYPLAGNQYHNNASLIQESSTLAEAWPVAIYPGVSTNSGAPTGNATSTTLDAGLSAYSLTYKPIGGGAPIPMGAFAFMESLASYTGAGCTGVCSGSQQLQLYAVSDGVHIPATNLAPKSEVDKIDVPSNLIQASEVDICFSSGTTNQSGLLTIGSGSGNGLGVSLQIYSGASC